MALMLCPVVGLLFSLFLLAFVLFDNLWWCWLVKDDLVLDLLMIYDCGPACFTDSAIFCCGTYILNRYF